MSKRNNSEFEKNKRKYETYIIKEIPLYNRNKIFLTNQMIIPEDYRIVKFFPDSTELMNSNEMNTCIKEYQIMKDLEKGNNENIGKCEFHGIAKIKNKTKWGCELGCYILQEYYPGDLHSYFCKQERSEKILQYMTYKLLKSVEYIHNYGIVHLDIKLENLRISKNGKIICIDFGSAKPAIGPKNDGKLKNNIFFTKMYQPYEVWKNFDNFNGFALDAFLIGMTIFLMVFRKQYLKECNGNTEPYKFLICSKYEKFFESLYKEIEKTKSTDLQNYQEKLNLIKNADFKNLFDNPLMELILGLIDPNPITRLTINEALNMPWVEQGKLSESEEQKILSELTKFSEDCHTEIMLSPTPKDTREGWILSHKKEIPEYIENLDWENKQPKELFGFGITKKIAKI